MSWASSKPLRPRGLSWSALEVDNLGRHALRRPIARYRRGGEGLRLYRETRTSASPKGFALQSGALGEAKQRPTRPWPSASGCGLEAILPAEAEVADPGSRDRGRIELGWRSGTGGGRGNRPVRGRGRVGVFRVVDAFEGARPPRIGLPTSAGTALPIRAPRRIGLQVISSRPARRSRRGSSAGMTSRRFGPQTRCCPRRL